MTLREARELVRYVKCFLLSFNNAALRQFIINDQNVRFEIQSFGSTYLAVIEEITKYGTFFKIEKSYNNTIIVLINRTDINLENLGAFYFDYHSQLKLTKRVKVNSEYN